MNLDTANTLLRGWSPPDTYATFCAVLVEVGVLADEEALLDFIRKPWKWAPEYVAWVDNGQPCDGDAGWDRFADTIHELLSS